MPDRGIYLRVTHLGAVPGSLLLADVGLGDGGRLSGVPRAGPHYVPYNGYIDLQYTEPVALSYISGNIRQFVDRGYLSATMMAGQDVHDAVQAWHGWANYEDSSGAQATLADSVWFDGYVDEWAYWNKSLTGGEVAQVYNGGTPHDLTLLGIAGNLKQWLLMGDGDAYPVLSDNAAGGVHDATMVNMTAINLVSFTP